MIIHGGDIRFGDDDTSTGEWDMSEDFIGDIEHIWQVSKDNPTLWNNLVSLLNTVESNGVCDGIFTSAQTPEIESKLSEFMEYDRTKMLIIRSLIDYGLILAFEYNSREIVVGYKNAQVKKCLLRAGLVLEMKAFATLCALRDKDGEPMYNDVLNGVVIDWDGAFHNGYSVDGIDTTNEIDVVAMHGVVPIFISCKNGNFNADELFKLSAVAEQFGGKYAKKVLIAAKLPEGVAGVYLRQRMNDLKIHLIEGLHGCSEKKIEEKLSKLWIK